jgi:hypothetical protein
LQDIPSPGPATRDEEEVWDKVGATTGRTTSPPPAVDDVVPNDAQEQAVTVEIHPQPSTKEGQGPHPAAATLVEQPKEREQEPPVEATTAREPDIVDIASLLGAPTITVVRSTL